MTAFLVTAASGFTRVNNENVLAVIAASEAQALAFAQGYRGNDPKAAWADADIIDIEGETAAAASLPGLGIEIVVDDGVAPFKVFSESTGLSVLSAAVVAGGTGWEVADIVTLAGGTFTRPATFTVASVNSGAVTGLTLLDPGVYSVLPTGTQNATGPGGAGLTVNTITGQQHTLANVAASLVGPLNLRDEIAGAAVNATTRILTIAAIADGIGDAAVTVRYLLNGVALPTYTDEIVDEGIAGAVLTLEWVASPVYPQLVRAMKSD
jgi:hypothetical protein